MTISKIKSILILALAILTIYQTGVLWFVNITNRNVLLNYFPFLQQVVIPEGVDSLVVPWRIVTAHPPGNTFSAQYNNLAYAESKIYSHLVLSQLVQTGRFEAIHPINYELLLAYPAYIYEYAFPMNPEWFTNGFGQRGSVINRPGLGNFRQVIIRPPIYDGVNAHIFFLCESGYAYEFSVAQPEGGSSFLHVIPERTVGPYYILAQDTLAQGTFVRHQASPFHEIAFTNPYLDAHGFNSIDFIQSRIGDFFSNLAAVRPIARDEVWEYWDFNSVVRYYAINILEYISYRPLDRSVPSSFLNNFAVAVQFIERDELVINEFYLADFREEDEYRHVFYFNYVVGDMSLTMPADWPEYTPLRYPIVVTIDRGTVARYRKLAFNFHITRRNHRGESLWTSFQEQR